MKRFLLSAAAGVIALAGLGLFASSASAHPVRYAPAPCYRAAPPRVHWWHYGHRVWFRPCRPC
jgi:hypothetical protein